MTEAQLDTGSAVSLSGVAKSYGSVLAVAGVDLRINRGEIVALLGPNGAGKSTLINMMLGLLPPDEGEIRLFGRTPARAVRSGQVGAMLQEGGLIPRVTVKELVGFVRGTYENPMPLPDVLRIARIGDLVRRRVDKLSGGQSQRVRFALALCGNPALIMLDEPTAALDVESRRELWAALNNYTQQGHTVLFSTHYLEEADDNADRIVVIANGRVAADGTGAEIKQIISGRVVSFDLRGAVPPGLDQLPGVTSVEIRGHRVYLHSSDSDATVLALALAEQTNNLEVAGVGLEDAFIALTSTAAADQSRKDS